MSDYSPLFLPGAEITVVASSTLTGGQTLCVSGDGTVAPTSSGTVAFVGVSMRDTASGAYGSMAGRGPVHLTTASGSITAGDRLVPAATGKVAALAAASGNAAADINNSRAVIGIALTTAADTATVKWMQI